jgi:glycosyltransferase involved in cell wall biosynthesis
MPPISAVIIAKNEEERIGPCLGSLKSFASEIVVIDSMSTDNTAAFCRERGCRVFHREFDGFGQQKQFAVDQAENDWVLSIDADEVVSPELQSELSQLKAAKSLPFDAYEIPFSLVYLGRVMKHSGLGREKHLRLFDRRKGNFTKTPVHEGIVTNGITGRLSNRILHYSYRDIRHHLEKINLYSSRAAEAYIQKGISFSRLAPALKFPASFISVYLVRGGFLDGYQGFLWSFFAALHASVKIAKTIELRKGNESA